MTNMLLSKYFVPSLFSVKVNSLNPCLNHFHPRRDNGRYQLTQSIKLSETSSGNSISRPLSFNSFRAPKHILYNVTLTKKPSSQAVHVLAGDIQQYSLAGLGRDNMPKHVAIILDGSRRWLKAHGRPLTYAPFFEANMLFADLSIKWGVTTATTFVYSLKNMQRGKETNDLLFGGLETFLDDSAEQFYRKGIKVCVIGEKSLIPQTLQNKIKQVEEATKDCTKLEFLLALCYSGTRDIVQATKNICEKVTTGMIELDAIDEALLDKELWTGGSRAPHIDLVIRTGGRLRVSDYLMWQLAYAELYFTNICAPEFSEPEFIEALRSFQRGERTFGK